MLQDDHKSRQTSTGGAAPRYALVYTTYGWDPFIESMYRRNAARVASGDLHVIADESAARVDLPPDCAKTIATPKAAADLGLRIAYHRALFWHNIDYLYYIFFYHQPNYDYYIFIDYDAYLDIDVDAFVSDIERREIDYVGAPVDGEIAKWTFAKQHAGTYGLEALDARISAVTVLSRAALAYLFIRRREMSACPTPAERAFWPICEAFVPSELKLAGFRSAALRDFGNVESFAWWPPTLDESLQASAPPGFVHPVLERTRFIGSILRHTAMRDLFRARSPFWRAIKSHPDWRWLVPLAAEFVRRLSRRFGLEGRHFRSAATVGMSPPPRRTLRALRFPHSNRAAMSATETVGTELHGQSRGNPAPSRIHLANL